MHGAACYRATADRSTAGPSPHPRPGRRDHGERRCPISQWDAGCCCRIIIDSFGSTGASACPNCNMDFSSQVARWTNTIDLRNPSCKMDEHTGLEKSKLQGGLKAMCCSCLHILQLVALSGSHHKLVLIDQL